MSVQLLRGAFILIDGFVADDLELVPTGTITSVPQVNGTANCILLQGFFIPRQGP